MDYDYGHGYGSTEAIFGLILVIWIVALCVSIVISFIVYVLTGLSMMALFRKTGVEPWAAWVPFFNTWRLLELGGQPGWMALLVLVPGGSLATLVFECIAAYRIGIAFRKPGSWVVLFYFLPYVWAWILAARNEVYDPDLMRQAGFSPPLVGFGSARGAYQPPTGAPVV